MKDIRIIKDKSGDVPFVIYGACEDGALMLLQRLYVLMFSESVEMDREGSGYTLLDLLQGGNRPPDSALTSIMHIVCMDAMNLLDPEDVEKIQMFTGECNEGVITCTLRLTDGTTIKDTF